MFFFFFLLPHFVRLNRIHLASICLKFWRNFAIWNCEIYSFSLLLDNYTCSLIGFLRPSRFIRLFHVFLLIRFLELVFHSKTSVYQLIFYVKVEENFIVMCILIALIQSLCRNIRHTFKLWTFYSTISWFLRLWKLLIDCFLSRSCTLQIVWRMRGTFLLMVSFSSHASPFQFPSRFQFYFA